MFKTSYPRYYLTPKGQNIFFKTNFPLDKFNPNKTLFVFNYGLVCNEAHWKFQLRHFDDLDQQVFIHDYRGHYNSATVEHFDSVTFENMTQDLHEVINFIGAKKIFMLGHSMGVNISLEYAKNFPEYLIALVLISGTVLPPQDVMFNNNLMNFISPLQKKALELFPMLYSTLWKTAFMNPLFRKAVYYGGFNSKEVPESFVETYMKKIGELHPAIFIRLFDEMKKHDIISHLENIKTKTLVITGELDKVIPLKVQEIVHQHLPNSELWTVVAGSHVPQVDFPDSINKKIEEFYNSIEA
jgi:non-heme chloroperoxidase